jgi:hypothetical protein
VLVALAILSTAIVASIQGFAQGLRLLKLAGDHQEAMLLADQVMRQVIDPTERRDESTEGRFSWERTIKAVDAPDLTPVGSPPKWRVFEINVTVRWDQRRSIELATFRTVPATSDPTRSGRPSGADGDER